MGTVRALNAASASDPGLQREVNEDRCHIDVSRGLFMVVDGVGGQLAGGKAADIALRMLRARLERETGPLATRVREAIVVANNEIYRVARTRPEFNGMACVLTLAIVDNGHAIVGHVGDTRLYKLRRGHIEKITHDHSPVGEREDSNELSELDAMRHPRRNEVYRDVGSEPHQAEDPDFIEMVDIAFEPDAALLLCSDGLTDLIESASIRHIVERLAGQPHQVVKALIEAAKSAGGKDNISVVYVEGERFAVEEHVGSGGGTEAGAARGTRRRHPILLALAALAISISGLAAGRLWPSLRWPDAHFVGPRPASPARLVVGPDDSISAALERAEPGAEIFVEPGEYHEALVLKSGVRLVSRVPRGATIRLAGTATEAESAVVASAVRAAEIVGFRIVGDAATPLGTGLLIRNSAVSVIDVEVTGAANVAVDVSDISPVSILASDIHDNPGAALAIRSGASPRIAHNVFTRNGLSQRVQGSFIIDESATPHFAANIFHGVSREAFGRLAAADSDALGRDNWFVDRQDVRSTTSTAPGGRRGR